MIVPQDRQGVFPILDVEGQRPADLVEVADTLSLARFLAGLSEHRKEQRRQDRCDGDDDQQLDEGETSPFAHVATSRRKPRSLQESYRLLDGASCLSCSLLSFLPIKTAAPF